MKDAIVIGAGIAGLSSALRLQSQGYSVTIIEKNSFIGGKTSLINNKYNSFNLTATMPILSKSLFELFNEIGEDLNYYIKYQRLDPFCKAFFKDGTSFEFSSDLKNLSENLSNEDFEDYLDLICDAKDIYSDKSFNTPNFKLSFRSLYNKVKSTNLSNTYNYFRNHLSNQNLVEALTFQSMQIGTSPFKYFTTSSLMPLINSIEGFIEIEGGINSFVKALSKVFLKRGGKYLLKTEVKSLNFKNNTCIGVSTNSGKTLNSSIVLCTSNFQYTLNNLIPQKFNTENYAFSKLEKEHITSSRFVLYLSIKKEFPQLSTHNIFINKDFKENINACFKGDIPKNPHLYVYKDSFKKGITNMSVILNVPNLLYLNEDFWTKDNIFKIEDLIFRTLEDFFKVRQLSTFILDKISISPITYKKLFNTCNGNFYQTYPNNSNLDFSKPTCKIEGINNLYFAGESINFGSGIFNVLKSSKIAVKTLIDDIKIRK
ncbi:phytoene desaturase family protein [Clostridium thermobutyricum]